MDPENKMEETISVENQLKKKNQEEETSAKKNENEQMSLKNKEGTTSMMNRCKKKKNMREHTKSIEIQPKKKNETISMENTREKNQEEENVAAVSL